MERITPPPYYLKGNLYILPYWAIQRGNIPILPRVIREEYSCFTLILYLYYPKQKAAYWINFIVGTFSFVTYTNISLILLYIIQNERAFIGSLPNALISDLTFLYALPLYYPSFVSLLQKLLAFLFEI